MGRPYPTLSEVGLVYDPIQKIEWIFADYIASKFSQSTIFHKMVSSLSFDEFIGNYDGIKTAQRMEQSLNQLYKSYFDEAVVEVIDDTPADSTVVNIIVKGVFTDAGKNYQMNEVLHVNNGKIKRLAKFN